MFKFLIHFFSGRVAELVYAYVSEAYPVRVGSSSLPTPTKNVNVFQILSRKHVRFGHQSLSRFVFQIYDLTVTRSVPLSHLLRIRILHKYGRRASNPLTQARRIWSRIISSSPLGNFRYPDSRPRLLARYPLRLSNPLSGSSAQRKNLPFRRFFALVPERGFEPPCPCERYHLKVVRLPISPPGLEFQYYRQ
jgi:hypothetical protein